MGLLVEGKWVDQWFDTKASGGKFQRQESSFRHWIRADSSTAFAPEPGRYHLYVSLACPWAHRTLLFRKLKKLEDTISLSVVHWFAGESGWEFKAGPGTMPDVINRTQFLHQVYVKANPVYTGRVTVPVLWDKKTGTVVNNESSEIIRMLNTEFNAIGDGSLDFYPAELRTEIDDINDAVYHNVNNGVYKCGFATTQEAYEEAFVALFDTLDRLEDRLATRRYLMGDRLTEADWRLFPTLVRFDPVYVGHFKCNLRRIADYPNLYNYLKELYQMPGIADTVNFTHIKNHYYGSHESVNPTRIVPKGPVIALDSPHNREAL